MSVQFHRIRSICLKLACVAVVTCSVSISGSSDEPNTTDLDETFTKPSMELALEDWQSEMSRVSATMSKISANIDKAFKQTQAHLTKVQEAAENFQNVAMRNVATQINSTVKDLSESIPKGTSIKAFFGLASSRLGERIAGIFDIRLIWPSCASPVQASSLLFRSGVGFRAH